MIIVLPLDKEIEEYSHIKELTKIEEMSRMLNEIQQTLNQASSKLRVFPFTVKLSLSTVRFISIDSNLLCDLYTEGHKPPGEVYN